VNVTLEPALLYRLLFGTLNVAVCPNCGRKAESAQPFVYHDMKRGLFAYVSPNADVPDETREALLNNLRRVYTQAVEESERLASRGNPPVDLSRPTIRRRTPAEDLQARIEPDAPPMQVIFGTDRLITLVDSLLEPEEKLGKVALNARGAGPAERDRLLGVAKQLAEQAACQIDIEDEPDNYTVWLYGPRARVNTLMKALGSPA
jgi:hypothetical protein